MSETKKVRALINLPHWRRIEDGGRLLRGQEGTVRVGEDEGDIHPDDFAAKLELGHVALVVPPKPAAKPKADEETGGDGSGSK